MSKTVEVYLGKPRWMQSEISALTEQIATLKTSLLPAGIRYDKDKVQTSPDDQMSAIFSRIDELERERDAKALERSQYIDSMRETFLHLSRPDYYDVLNLRFIANLTVKDTAKQMKIDEQVHEVPSQGKDRIA